MGDVAPQTPSEPTSPNLEKVKTDTHQALDELKNHSLLPINPNQPHYKRALSRQTGEEQLFMHAKNAKKEEIWIYTKNKKGEEIWNESGIKEEKTKSTINLANFQKAITDTKVQEISIYHHHPIQNLKNRNISEALNHIPSAQDLANSFGAIVRISETNPQMMNQIDFRIVGTLGVMVIKIIPTFLVDQVDEAYVGLFLQKIQKENKAIENGKTMKMNQNSDPKEKVKQIQQWATDHSNRLILFTFEPKRN